jgi:hypothetical protein
VTIVAVVSLTRSAWRSIAMPSHIRVSVSGMPSRSELAASGQVRSSSEESRTTCGGRR